jgi:hypothetical protein
MIIPLFYNTEYYSHFKQALPKVKEEEEEEGKPAEEDEIHHHIKLNKSAEELN